MAEVLANAGNDTTNIEQVKYSNDTFHLYEKPVGGKKIHIKTDDYIRSFGHDPTPQGPPPESEALPAVAEGNASAKATAAEMAAQVAAVNGRLDQVIPPNEQPPIAEAERKFQTGHKVKVVVGSENGDETQDNWEVVETKGRNSYGEIVYIVKSPDETQTREISEALLENMQLAPEGKIDSFGNQFDRFEERFNERFGRRLAKIEARLGIESSEEETQVMPPVVDGDGKAERREGPGQEVRLRGRNHDGVPYVIRVFTDGRPLEINYNIDKAWNVIGDEEGWFPAPNGLEIDLMNPPEAPEDKKLKTWTLKEGKEDGEELEIEEGDTAVIRLPDGSFNKDGKIKDIVEEDSKRYVIITMPDGTEHKIAEEDYLKGHIESGNFDEVDEIEEEETQAIEETGGGDGELGPPQTGLKARWNQLKNWLKGKRGKARDAAIAAQAAAINKANGITEPPDDPNLSKEQKERKHKCRRLAFFLGGAALAGGGVVLAWWLTSKYGVNPFDNSPSGPESVPPPTGPKNLPGPEVSGWHSESLEPYNAGGGSFNHYDAGTLWDHTIDDLQEQIGQRPTDVQIQRATQMVLDHNNVSWEEARHLPVGFKFEVPNHFPDWVINGR